LGPSLSGPVWAILETCTTESRYCQYCPANHEHKTLLSQLLALRLQHTICTQLQRMLTGASSLTSLGYILSLLATLRTHMWQLARSRRCQFATKSTTLVYHPYLPALSTSLVYHPRPPYPESVTRFKRAQNMRCKLRSRSLFALALSCHDAASFRRRCSGAHSTARWPAHAPSASSMCTAGRGSRARLGSTRATQYRRRAA